MLRNHKRGGKGLGLWAGPGQGPGPRPGPPLVWFLSILRLSLGLQNMNYGSQASSLENLSVVDSSDRIVQGNNIETAISSLQVWTFI